MPSVLAVFGAGPGLGRAVARRFGREGYAVALVARRPGPLDALAEELAAEGVETAVFPADLADPAAGTAAVDAIRARFGRIDTLYYGPTAADPQRTTFRDLRADPLRPFLDVVLLTPIEVANAVLPELLERGAGAMLFSLGGSAVAPIPGMGVYGPAMAAVRSYAHGVHAEVAGRGVAVATLAITAMITGSAAYEALQSGALVVPEGVTFPVVEADALADVLWDLAHDPGRAEAVHP